MNKGFDVITNFLGKKTTEELQDAIKELILDRIRQDLDEYYEYLIDPDDIMEFVQKCKDEAFNRVKEGFVDTLEKQLWDGIKA